MERTFKSMPIGGKLIHNNIEYTKVETVYKANNCCIPEYNAINEQDGKKALISPNILVEEIK